MRREPCIGAVYVKPMPALRKNANLVALGELGEADGAFHEAPTIGRLGAVRHLRQRPKGVLIETLDRRGRRGPGGRVPEPCAAGHQGEANDADKGAEQGRQDDR